MLGFFIPWLDTLPVPERNMLEWAFVLGIAGCLLCFLSGVWCGYLFFGWRYRKNVKKWARRPRRSRLVPVGKLQHVDEDRHERRRQYQISNPQGSPSWPYEPDGDIAHRYVPPGGPLNLTLDIDPGTYGYLAGDRVVHPMDDYPK